MFVQVDYNIHNGKREESDIILNTNLIMIILKQRVIKMVTGDTYQLTWGSYERLCNSVGLKDIRY